MYHVIDATAEFNFQAKCIENQTTKPASDLRSMPFKNPRCTVQSFVLGPPQTEVRIEMIIKWFEFNLDLFMENNMYILFLDQRFSRLFHLLCSTLRLGNWHLWFKALAPAFAWRCVADHVADHAHSSCWFEHFEQQLPSAPSAHVLGDPLLPCRFTSWKTTRAHPISSFVHVSIVDSHHAVTPPAGTKNSLILSPRTTMTRRCSRHWDWDWEVVWEEHGHVPK